MSGPAVDLSTLEEHENVSSWLDDLLNRDVDTKSLYNLDKTLSNILKVLENAITDTSIAVDKSVSEIETGVPRLALDLQLMKENALLLKYSLETIHSKTHHNIPPQPLKFEDDINDQVNQDETDHILSRLKTMDLIKSRMESSRVVLREAEAWSTLESEVTGYLSDPIPSHLKAAERLSEAAKSMVVFQHTPEYEGRRSLMRSLQNELEASLSTNLVKALSDKDVRKCKEFYEIFQMIEREGEFKNYYFGSRRSQIFNLWKDSMAGSSTSISQEQPFLLVFLKDQFYPALLKLLQVELDFLPHIFTHNPIETLSSFLKSTIEHLQPSLSSQLSDMLDSTSILISLPCLVSCWSVTEDFGCKVESLIFQLSSTLKAEKQDPISHSGDGINVTTTSADSSSAAVQTSTRRRSVLKKPHVSRRSGSRMGFEFLPASATDVSHHNNNSSSEETMMKEWELSLYEPFLDFQTSYSEREQDYLTTSLINLNTSILKKSGQIFFRSNNSETNVLTSHADRIVPEMLTVLFSLGEDAIDRCEAFTHGYDLVGCLSCVDRTLAEYVNEVWGALEKERIGRENRKAGTGKAYQIENDSNRGISYSATATAATASGFDGETMMMSDLEGLDYSAEDWEVFQHGLKLLSMCKSLFAKLRNFEAKSLSRIKEVLNRLVQNDRESLGFFTTPTATYESLPSPSPNSANKIIKLSKGAKSLLKVSRLNSKELWELIELILPNSAIRPDLSATIGLDRKSSIGQATEMTMISSPSSVPHKQHISRASIISATSPSSPSPLQLATPKPRKLYPSADIALTKLIKESQLAVQSIILSPLLRTIDEYPNLPIWTQTEHDFQKSQLAKSVSTIELKILHQFSKSPTNLVSRLGEGLFNLPRLFEVHTTVEEHALGFSVGTLPYIVEEDHHHHHYHYHQEFIEGSSSTGGSMSSEMTISTWLSSLTLTVLHKLVEEVLPKIVGLSSGGGGGGRGKSGLTEFAKVQVLIDLDYLNNVVKALDVDNKLLEDFRDRIIGTS